GLSALHAAVEGGHEDVVRLLIQHGADVNPTTEPQKQTPLHYAARKGNSVIAHILLRRGADPNAHSSDGITPLEFAVHFGHR
ncbi:ankyrin repeat-containing domain protein, partial [Baffinella frigidus]